MLNEKLICSISTPGFKLVSDFNASSNNNSLKGLISSQWPTHWWCHFCRPLASSFMLLNLMRKASELARMFLEILCLLCSIISGSQFTRHCCFAVKIKPILSPKLDQTSVSVTWFSLLDTKNHITMSFLFLRQYFSPNFLWMSLSIKKS